MSWLPSLFKKKDEIQVVQKQQTELIQKQTEALTTLAESTKAIATFLSGGGLTDLVSQHARSQIAQGILSGLASHAGRDALDARTMGQNATEIVHIIEKIFDKAAERQKARADGERLDEQVHDAEASFKAWQEKRKQA